MDKDAVFLEEERNLSETLVFLRSELEREIGILGVRREEINDANAQMLEEMKWNEGMQTANIAHHLEHFNVLTQSAHMADSQVRKYTSMLSSPYFGRFDFIEDGYEAEKIHIGRYNLMDTKSLRIYVYDWRAPISSIYYRYELGDCYYISPQGRVDGKTTLKRQYQIENGQLKFYFDSAIAIRDEILIMALSQNSTQKMKNIVETIQKEQDYIIRDLSHRALIVQGVAGSGKTSVALHRAAYLLYENEKGKLAQNDILIISPNVVFSDYIDSVLPSLGEENVETIVIDQLFRKSLKGVYIQPKNKFLESLVSANDNQRRKRQAHTAFLCSEAFMRIIERFVSLYERRLHNFEDITVGGVTVITAQQIKALFLDNKAGLTAENRLKRIEFRIREYAEPHLAAIYKRYKPRVYNNPKLRFEEEAHIQSVMSKYRAKFEQHVKRQLKLNVISLFKQMLKCDAVLGNEPNKDLIKQSFNAVLKSLKKEFLPYEAAAGVLYLKLLVCGGRQYRQKKHIIIDEAQDYYPLHYHLFNKIFAGASFTVLGDINQTIDKESGGLYEEIGKILTGKDDNALFVSLTKSYRSSKEITAFTNAIIGKTDEYEAVERTGEKPHITVCDSISEMHTAIAEDIRFRLREGCPQIAIITKTTEDARTAYDNIDVSDVEKRLLGAAQDAAHIGAGINILPVYMAKGLEFDAAIIYNASDTLYYTSYDNNLLYIACTRALHKLSVYAHKTISRFITMS